MSSPAPISFQSYCECPHECPSDLSAVFLAGGITGCPDWQQDAASKLFVKCPDLTVLNPRRADFDVTDPNASKKQIAWEHKALRQAKIILFWFPEETLCPITLFELGVWSEKCKHADTIIKVGCHPNYKRITDVNCQLLLSGFEDTIHENLDDLIESVSGAWEILKVR